MRNVAAFIGLGGSAACLLAGFISLMVALFFMASDRTSVLPPGLYLSFGLYFIGKGAFIASMVLLMADPFKWREAPAV